MKCKEGVEIVKGGVCVTAQTLHAMAVADVVCSNFGVEAVCTALLDGKHITGSKHYIGDAFDLRNRDVPEGQRQAFRDDLALRLGPDYDVVLEATHFHVEYDPKG